jgi:hypothetical protein
MANKAKVTYDFHGKLFSTSDLANYLQNVVLGFPIGTSYRTFGLDGYNPSYVEMCIAIDPKDILVANKNPDFIDRMLQKTGAQEPLKEDVIKRLEPYMFPKEFAAVRNFPDTVANLRAIGIYGEFLDKLIDQSKLTCGIDPQTGQKAFSVALRPEKIIEEMLTDPATGKLEDGGSLKIRTIIGRPNLPETIRWEVLNNVNVGNNSLNGVNINAIFSNASYKVQ